MADLHLKIWNSTLSIQICDRCSRIFQANRYSYNYPFPLGGVSHARMGFQKTSGSKAQGRTRSAIEELSGREGAAIPVFA